MKTIQDTGAVAVVLALGVCAAGLTRGQGGRVAAPLAGALFAGTACLAPEAARTADAVPPRSSDRAVVVRRVPREAAAPGVGRVVVACALPADAACDGARASEPPRDAPADAALPAPDCAQAADGDAAAPGRASAAAETLDALAALCTASAGAREGALALLRDPAASGEVKAALLAGLAGCGDRGAEAEVAEVACGAAFDTELRRAAVLALARAGADPGAAAAALDRVLREDPGLAPAAAFVLGELGARRPGDAALGDRVAEVLEPRLGTDPRLDLELLAALGRVGAPRSLPVLLAAARGNDAAQRVVGTYALRGQDDDEARAMLVHRLAEDPCAEVRVAAAEAAGCAGDAATRTALARHALHDPDPGVRAAAARGLIQRARREPEAATLLRTVAEQSTSPEICAAACAALQQ